MPPQGGHKNNQGDAAGFSRHKIGGLYPAEEIAFESSLVVNKRDK